METRRNHSEEFVFPETPAFSRIATRNRGNRRVWVTALSRRSPLLVATPAAELVYEMAAPSSIIGPQHAPRLVGITLECGWKQGDCGERFDPRNGFWKEAGSWRETDQRKLVPFAFPGDCRRVGNGVKGSLRRAKKRRALDSVPDSPGETSRGMKAKGSNSEVTLPG